MTRQTLLLTLSSLALMFSVNSAGAASKDGDDNPALSSSKKVRHHTHHQHDDASGDKKGDRKKVSKRSSNKDKVAPTSTTHHGLVQTLEDDFKKVEGAISSEAHKIAGHFHHHSTPSVTPSNSPSVASGSVPSAKPTEKVDAPTNTPSATPSASNVSGFVATIEADIGNIETAIKNEVPIIEAEIVSVENTVKTDVAAIETEAKSLITQVEGMFHPSSTTSNAAAKSTAEKAAAVVVAPSTPNASGILSTLETEIGNIESVVKTDFGKVESEIKLVIGGVEYLFHKAPTASSSNSGNAQAAAVVTPVVASTTSGASGILGTIETDLGKVEQAISGEVGKVVPEAKVILGDLKNDFSGILSKIESALASGAVTKDVDNALGAATSIISGVTKFGPEIEGVLTGINPGIASAFGTFLTALNAASPIIGEGKTIADEILAELQKLAASSGSTPSVTPVAPVVTPSIPVVTPVVTPSVPVVTPVVTPSTPVVAPVSGENSGGAATAGGTTTV